jgi:anti-sigma regulatory factor (Ser/Thr protein kinase)
VSTDPRTHRLRASLDRSPTAPRRARRLLASWLSEVDCPDRVKDDAVLAVSELVSNTIVHTASAPILEATYDDGRLRVEVRDDDPGEPAMLAPDDRISGYGLRIISQIADDWGWQRLPNGKAVWTEMLC